MFKRRKQSWSRLIKWWIGFSLQVCLTLSWRESPWLKIHIRALDLRDINLRVKEILCLCWIPLSHLRSRANSRFQRSNLTIWSVKTEIWSTSLTKFWPCKSRLAFANTLMLAKTWRSCQTSLSWAVFSAVILKNKPSPQDRGQEPKTGSEVQTQRHKWTIEWGRPTSLEGVNTQESQRASQRTITWKP